jgi:hypothetical protein
MNSCVKVYECSALIELTTSTMVYVDKTDGKKYASEMRPNLYVDTHDERTLLLVRDKDELNRTDSFDMITPAPRVEMAYDRKKQYCPKYKVTFFVETPFSYTFIATFMPIVTIVLLGIGNVLNGEGEGPALDNSIAIILTLVFLLPSLKPEGRGDVNDNWIDWILSNNLCIVLLFLGLLCTSIRLPRWYADTRIENAENNITDPYIAYVSRI